MIPVSIDFQHSKNKPLTWQKEMACSFKRLDGLLDFLDIQDEQRAPFIELAAFPLRVTQFYANLIEKNNPSDPLLLQVIPQVAETIPAPQFTSDAVGDLAATQHPGLIHKYFNRVLLTLTEACGIHCRYCFRRAFPYSDNMPDFSINGEIMTYLHNQQHIEEVILSGGDPLMLSDGKLLAIIQQMNSLTHINTLRIHTRMPSILPSRVSYELLEAFKQCNKTIVLVNHINHPNEISEEFQHAMIKLKNSNIVLLNQSVLLKHVNDDAETLINLSKGLFKSGVLPYYLHCLDKVAGAAHFDITRTQAISLMRQIKNYLPGYLVPKLVEENSGETAKTHINY